MQHDLVRRVFLHLDLLLLLPLLLLLWILRHHDGRSSRRRSSPIRHRRRHIIHVHVHPRPQVAHETAGAARDELGAEGRKDGVEDVDAVDGQQVAADLALQKVRVARARDVVLPDAARRRDVDAVDRAEAAGGDDGADRPDGRRHARLQADDGAHVLRRGEGGEGAGLRRRGRERPFDEDGRGVGFGFGFAGVGVASSEFVEGGERDGGVGVDARADDDQVDGGVGGEVGGGGVGGGGRGQVVGRDRLVGFGEGRVAEADNLIVWRAAEVGEVGEHGPRVRFARQADEADADPWWWWWWHLGNPGTTPGGATLFFTAVRRRCEGRRWSERELKTRTSTRGGC